MVRNELSPAGCRRHTRALAWVRELDEGFEGTDKRPGEVLSIVKKAAPYIGLSAQHEILLDKLFMGSKLQDWDGTSPVGPVVFFSNETLADMTNRSLPTTKRLLSDLIELGLVCPRDSANGRRWGNRHKDGHLTEAFGFSLSPCAARYEEFAEAAGRRLADRKERGQLKATITREKKRIAAAAAKAEAGWDLFRGWLAEVGVIVSQRARASLKKLRDLAARITELRVEAEAAAELSLGPDARADWTPSAERAEDDVENRAESASRTTFGTGKNGVGASTSRPKGLETDTPITATQQTHSLRESCSSQTKGEWRRLRPFGPSPQVIAEEDLEKHGVIPSMVLKLVGAPMLPDIGREPDWAIVHAEAEQLAHARGFDGRLVSQLMETIGRRAASVAVITTARKGDRRQVMNEGGYLRSLLEIARTGELKLGKTVWGLVRAAEGEVDADTDRMVPA